MIQKKDTKWCNKTLYMKLTNTSIIKTYKSQNKSTKSYLKGVYARKITSRHKLISLPKWLRDDSKFEMGDRKCPLDFNLWPPDPIDNIHTLHKIHIFILILKIMNAHCKSMNLVFLLKRKTQLKNVFFYWEKRNCVLYNNWIFLTPRPLTPFPSNIQQRAFSVTHFEFCHPSTAV